MTGKQHSPLYKCKSPVQVKWAVKSKLNIILKERKKSKMCNYIAQERVYCYSVSYEFYAEWRQVDHKEKCFSVFIIAKHTR